MTNKYDSLTEAQKTKVRKHLSGLFLNGNVSFRFYKKDGTLRDSVGCLDQAVMEANNALPKEKSESEQKPINLNVFKYFDLDKKAWRSFNLSSLEDVMKVKFDDLIDKIITNP